MLEIVGFQESVVLCSKIQYGKLMMTHECKFEPGRTGVFFAAVIWRSSSPSTTKRVCTPARPGQSSRWRRWRLRLRGGLFFYEESALQSMTSLVPWLGPEVSAAYNRDSITAWSGVKLWYGLGYNLQETLFPCKDTKICFYINTYLCVCIHWRGAPSTWCATVQQKNRTCSWRFRFHNFNLCNKHYKNNPMAK